MHIPDEVTVHLPDGPNGAKPPDGVTVLVPGAMLAPAPTPESGPRGRRAGVRRRRRWPQAADAPRRDADRAALHRLHRHHRGRAGRAQRRHVGRTGRRRAVRGARRRGRGRPDDLGSRRPRRPPSPSRRPSPRSSPNARTRAARTTSTRPPPPPRPSSRRNRDRDGGAHRHRAAQHADPPTQTPPTGGNSGGRPAGRRRQPADSGQEADGLSGRGRRPSRSRPARPSRGG